MAMIGKPRSKRKGRREQCGDCAEPPLFHELHQHEQQRRDQGCFFRKHGEPEEQSHRRQLVRPACVIQVERDAPERERGGEDIGMGQRTLREPDGIERSKQCDGSSAELAEQWPGDPVDGQQSERRGRCILPYACRSARTHRDATTRPAAPTAAAGARCSMCSVGPACRCESSQTPRGCSTRPRPRSRAGAAA